MWQGTNEQWMKLGGCVYFKVVAIGGIVDVKTALEALGSVVETRVRKMSVMMIMVKIKTATRALTIIIIIIVLLPLTIVL